MRKAEAKKQKKERPEEARFESTVELRNALHFRDERRLHSEGRTFVSIHSGIRITSVIYRADKRDHVSITITIYTRCSFIYTLYWSHTTLFYDLSRNLI